MLYRVHGFVAALSLLSCGCVHISSNDPPHDPPTMAAVQSHGYALLDDLMGDESNVSKLLIVKRERPELGILIKRISSICGQAHERLEKFASADPRVNIKDQGLPAAEVETRKEISRTRGKELLAAKGKEFELQLLLDQNEALTYGSHLAATIVRGEESSTRADFLRKLSVELGQLRQRVVSILLEGYTWEGSK